MSSCYCNAIIDRSNGRNSKHRNKHVCYKVISIDLSYSIVNFVKGACVLGLQRIKLQSRPIIGLRTQQNKYFGKCRGNARRPTAVA